MEDVRTRNILTFRFAEKTKFTRDERSIGWKRYTSDCEKKTFEGIHARMSKTLMKVSKSYRIDADLNRFQDRGEILERRARLVIRSAGKKISSFVISPRSVDNKEREFVKKEGPTDLAAGKFLRNHKLL